jgi:hypothetical protein
MNYLVPLSSFLDLELEVEIDKIDFEVDNIVVAFTTGSKIRVTLNTVL